jgi:glucokinase
LEITWIKEPEHHEELILSGDIGGSNTNIALVGRTGLTYQIIVKFRFDSRKVELFESVLQTCIEEIRRVYPGIYPDKCCICASGPISDNRCTPTHLSWYIDGRELEKRFSFPASVMNDFQAICFGLPLLDLTDSEIALPIPHADGSIPASSGASWAVAGAGTGLGVGHLSKINGSYMSFPSEGGHTGFAPFDEETEALYHYVASRYSTAPGTELFLSGRGMTEIFNFLRDVKSMEISGSAAEINSAALDDIPRLITKYTPSDSRCRGVMKLFIKIYGHFAARVSLFYLPAQGMFLAGGIASRHAKLFVEDDTFMAAFENSYNPVMKKVLSKIPVYLVRDYSMSLLGAAHAAVNNAAISGDAT